MFSPDLQGFIRSSVRSVWAVELLLLFRRQPGPWTFEQLVQELRASPPIVEPCLGAFEAAGLVRRTPEGWIYAPVAAVLDGYAEELEAAYRERPGAVVRAILSSPNDKLQSFANAFRLKGDPD